LSRRNAVDLLCVENRIDAMYESISAAVVTLVGELVSIGLSVVN